MRDNINLRIEKVLDHGKFIMGPEVAELEEKLADYVGVSHCISCANGTDALQLSLMALGIGPGDIVFTTAFSFFATAEVIPLTGALPYFVDIDLATYNICPDSLENAIQDSLAIDKGTPKAVIAVDMFGLPANYSALQTLCNKYGLFLIEDGAQSFGASIGEQKCGGFGDIATTSFFPAKPLGCYGDGGAIFTNNDELASLSKSLRIHGKGADKYHNERIGLNSRLDTLQAAILLEKLLFLDRERVQKKALADRYNASLPEHCIPPIISDHYVSAWAQYTLLVKNTGRDLAQAKLKSMHIPSAIYYPKPLNEQRAFNCMLSTPTPNTIEACSNVFSLPMHAYMSAQEKDKMLGALAEL